MLILFFFSWLGVPTYLKLRLPYLNGMLIAWQINNWILELLSASFIENILWVTYVLSLDCLHIEGSLWYHNVICTPYLTNFIFNAIAIHHWWNRGFWCSVLPTFSKKTFSNGRKVAIFCRNFLPFVNFCKRSLFWVKYPKSWQHCHSWHKASIKVIFAFFSFFNEILMSWNMIGWVLRCIFFTYWTRNSWNCKST